MKRIFTILFALVLALSLSLVTAVPATAATTLIATGPAGTEARIVVPVAAGTTLGDINSISWLEKLVNGYPPHVDIYLDWNDDDVADDALVVEYAYNTATHYGEAHTSTEAYGAVTGVWSNTFNDDGNGPSVVTDTTFAWLNSGAPGPYPVTVGLPIAYGSVPGNFVGGSLGEWKAGNIVPGITGATEVLRLEIEVDNWIKDTEAEVKDISLNAGSSVGMTVNVPDIVAISVTPTSIDFGTLVPGQTSSEFDITVINIGTHKVDVDADVTGTGGDLFFDNLLLKGGGYTTRDWPIIVNDLAVGFSAGLKTKLPVPSSYTPGGVETATLIFTATGV